jgi:hypothetical protein
MKNLKMQYEKVEDYDWLVSFDEEAQVKSSRKLHKGKKVRKSGLDRKGRRVRLTWD